jgi:hypothetical protein
MNVSLPSNECLVSVTKVSDYCTWFHDAYSSLKVDNYSTNEGTSCFSGLLLWEKKLITWSKANSVYPFTGKLCVCVCVCVCMCTYIHTYIKICKRMMLHVVLCGCQKIQTEVCGDIRVVSVIQGNLINLLINALTCVIHECMKDFNVLITVLLRSLPNCVPGEVAKVA